MYCGDYTANSSTEFYDGAITGTLINSATGNVTKLGPVTRHPLSMPFPRKRGSLTGGRVQNWKICA